VSSIEKMTCRFVMSSAVSLEYSATTHPGRRDPAP
jgi:hypothetical protein